MTDLPTSIDSLVVRTDFSDDAAFTAVLDAARAPRADGSIVHVRVVESRQWEGADWHTLRDAGLVAEGDATVLFAIDQKALSGDHAVLAIDLGPHRHDPFRCLAGEVGEVDAAINTARRHWGDFERHLDGQGIFRGFA